MNLTVSVSFYFYLYLLFIRAAGLQVQRESTAILTLQEAMDFVNTLHPGGIREPMF